MKRNESLELVRHEQYFCGSPGGVLFLASIAKLSNFMDETEEGRKRKKITTTETLQNIRHYLQFLTDYDGRYKFQEGTR